DLVAPQLQERAHQDEHGDERKQAHERLEGLAGEDERHRLARQRRAPHGHRHRANANAGRERDAPAHAAGHADQPTVEIHRYVAATRSRTRLYRLRMLRWLASSKRGKSRWPSAYGSSSVKGKASASTCSSDRPRLTTSSIAATQLRMTR